MKSFKTISLLAVLLMFAAFGVADSKADACTGSTWTITLLDWNSSPLGNRGTSLTEIDPATGVFVAFIDGKRANSSGVAVFDIPYCGWFRVDATKKNLPNGAWLGDHAEDNWQAANGVAHHSQTMNYVLF